jgi:hypothetical protein
MFDICYDTMMRWFLSLKKKEEDPFRLVIFKPHSLTCSICQNRFNQGELIQHNSVYFMHAKCSIFLKHNDGGLTTLDGEEPQKHCLTEGTTYLHRLATILSPEEWEKKLIEVRGKI